MAKGICPYRRRVHLDRRKRRLRRSDIFGAVRCSSGLRFGLCHRTHVEPHGIGRPTRTTNGRLFVIRHLLRRNELYNASMAVFRRSALPSAADYAGFRYAGDWLFWMLTALQGNVTTIFEPLNAFRRHETATTTHGEQTGELYTEVLQILQIIFGKVKIASPVRWALEGKQLCRLRKAYRKSGYAPIYQTCRNRWRSVYPHTLLRRMWYKIYGALPDTVFF